MTLLLVGISTRALADSAVQANLPVVTVDLFGDRDQKERVENLSLRRDLQWPCEAWRLVKVAERVEAAGVVPIANLENYPELVSDLARGRVLHGNPPQVLAAVRDWGQLCDFCVQADIPFPTTFLPGEEDRAAPDRQWLTKPIRGGGGRHIRTWDGQPLDDETMLQVFIPGRPISAAFLADGRRCILLGLTEQFLGQPSLGVSGFRWCGNLFPLDLPVNERDPVWTAVERITASLVARFNLIGLNGIDMVLANDGRPYLVEVNPRYTASMELFEIALGQSLLPLHLDACEGRLPSPQPSYSLPSGRYWGKGIVFARSDCVMPDTAGWRERGRRDIPFPSERVEAGDPICTILVQAEGRAACWEALVRASDELRREIGDSLGDDDD